MSALLACLLYLAEVHPVVAAPANGPGSSWQARKGAPERLRGWIRDFSRQKHAASSPVGNELSPILYRLRDFVDERPEERREVVLLLLDAMAAGMEVADGPDVERAAEGITVEELCETELDRTLDDELVQWLAETVVLDRGNPAYRRAAGVRMLHDHDSDAARMALVVAARSHDAPVAEAALEALVGVEDEGVHRMFIRILTGDDAPGRELMRGSAEAHFRRVRLPRDSDAVAPLFRLVRDDLTDQDWRNASRAVSVCRALDDELVVPLLIEALEVWMQRAADGEPVRRLQDDMARELERRTGKPLGYHPERWRSFWKAVLEGRAAVHPGGAPASSTTSASFFGLRPVTDRVVFVLDRSGSMAYRSRFHLERSESGDETRYSEAIDQMLLLLSEMGERTSFNVVLFSDDWDSWRTDLAPATDANLGSARKWLVKHRPDGGTHLEQAFAGALELDEKGRPDLERLEADTVIVLCDGETGDGGPRWVTSLVRRTQPFTQVRVHCVQIGGHGDGTLEALASETGGEYLRVGL